MSKKSKKQNKTKKNAAKGNGEIKKPRKGGLGDIFGYSVTAVLRRLGNEGVTCAHARAIVKELGIIMSDHSVDVQVGFGRHKTRPVAPITEEEVQRLRLTAQEPKKLDYIDPQDPRAKIKLRAREKKRAAEAAKAKKAEARKKKKSAKKTEAQTETTTAVAA